MDGIGFAQIQIDPEHHSWQRRGQQIYNYLEHGGPLDLHLMPEARNRADIAAALTS
jgi:hypothetical protein